MGKTRSITVLGPRKACSTDSVSMTNSTVEVIRAQFLPWPLARAIHSHSAIPMPADRTATIRNARNAESIWVGVYLGNSLRSAGLMVLMNTRERTRLTVLMAAPTYMSLTAFCTGLGAAAWSGSRVLSLDG